MDAEGYVDEVLSGRRRECRWVRLACERHRRDLEQGAARGLWFDERAARLVLAFFGLLRHSKGEWAGQAIALEPWQQFHLWNLFGWKREDGTRRFRISYLEVARKNGKMLSLDTLIPTPNGFTTIGEISNGDFVFAPDGSICRVTAISDIDYSPVTYRMVFSNGEVVKACADHQWVTTARVDSVNALSTGKRRRIRRWKGPSIQLRGDYLLVQTYKKQVYVGRADLPESQARAESIIKADLASHPVGVNSLTRVRTTEEIFLSQRYGARGDVNHSLKMPQPLDLPDADLPIDPYVLGVWLGDGSKDSGLITSGPEDAKEMISILEARGCRVFRKDYVASRSSATLRVEGLRPLLRLAGLLWDKFIPSTYLRASFQQRLELLQGLMDTDGTVSASGKVFEFTTTSETLAKGVTELLATLGIKYSCVEKDATLKGVVVGPKWRIQFNAFADKTPVFKLKRKLNRMRMSPAGKPRSTTVQIVKVEPCEPVPMKCIEVDHPSHEYLFGRSMLPTHNSTMGAGVGLYLQAADGEPGAEIFTAATKRDQARIVHQEAVRMVKQSPALARELSLFKDNIHSEKTFSKFEPLGRDSNTLDGLNVHGAIVDEVHAHPSGDLWDVLLTGTGSRRQPLLYAVTTAGYDRNSLCFQLHDYTEKVLSGVLEDDAWHGLIYTLDKDAEGLLDDWEDEANWFKANPNLGVSKKLDSLRDQARVAKGMPARLNAFLQKELNVWTAASARWIDPEAWRACNLGEIDEADLEGQACWGGLDLSTTLDVTALVWVFPVMSDERRVTSYVALARLWVPEENVRERVKRDRVPYDVWIRQGWLRTTPGNVVDYDFILEDVRQDLTRFKVAELAFDPWNATSVSNKLMQEGAPMVEFRQGFVSMNPAMKTLEVAVQRRLLNHGGNPVLAWMADNLVASSDPAGNLKPDKGKSTEKIDGMVALVMGLQRAAAAGKAAESVYGSRGLRTF